MISFFLITTLNLSDNHSESNSFHVCFSDHHSESESDDTSMCLCDNHSESLSDNHSVSESESLFIFESERRKFNSVQFCLFLSPIGARTLKMPVPYSPPNVGAYTRTPSHQPLLFGRKGTDHLPRMISSCPNYLHADVSDGEDLSRHQQEVNSRQLVTMSLVPGTVDYDVASECHLCCPPPLRTEAMSSLDGS